MSRVESPLRDRMIFAFGAQRSGTYWLQRMLTAHPLISAVPSETYLFAEGIKTLFERFHHGLRSSPAIGQLHVERDVLLDATRDFCDAVLHPHLEPGSRYLSERSPGHVKALEVIGQVYPDAHLVHIIRDGRDVTRSLAARSWGPGTIAGAAREWRESIEAARAAAPAERYREVRYEEMLADPQAGIVDLFEWLGLPVDDEVLEAVLAAADRKLNQDPKDPRIGLGKWRDHFSDEDLAAFDAEAGGLLAELGYADAGVWRPRAETAEPESAPAASAGMLARARALIGRGRQPAEPAGPDAAWEVGGVLAESQRTADALLAALHAGGDLTALLPPQVTLRVVSAEADERRVGEAAIRELAADPAWSERQVHGENHPGIPNYSLVLVYELPDGDRIARVLQLRIRDGLVEAMTIYRLALASTSRMTRAGTPPTTV